MSRHYLVGDCAFPELNATARAHGRPVVVIDPEDREQVARLIDALADAERDKRRDYIEPNSGVMQAALREFANPKPPRMDEPSMWGVVEASCVHSDIRREWVKFPSGNWRSVRNLTKCLEDIENPDDWDSLIDPTLVREGVTP